MPQRRQPKGAPFAKIRNADVSYGRALRKVAKHVSDLLQGLLPLDPERSDILQSLLRDYSKTLTPWARAVAAKMLQDVSQRDLRAWAIYTKEFGHALHQELTLAPTGLALQEFLNDQVKLITSLPIEAGQRVHNLVLQGMSRGSRGQDVVADILRTGLVTRNRATLIARTECARVGAGLTMVRAQSIGSAGYTWNTVGDEVVRKTHKAMQGKFIRWDSPPQVEPGKFYHAGMYPNCRCFAEPLIPR